MRALLLSALLLSTPVAAQNTSPSLPAPAATAPSLLITAPVGTTVEQRLKITSRMTLKDVQIETLSGRPPNARNLEEARRGLAEDLSGELSRHTGKVFTRVISRGADGRVGLLQTFLQNMPGMTTPLTFRITQTITPSGQSEDFKATSDHQLLNDMLSRMNPAQVQQLAREDGLLLTYGLALVKGQTHEQTIETPMQDLIAASVFPLLAELDIAPGAVTVPPLNIQYRTTYTGRNAAGLHEFQTRSQLGPWQVELGEAQSLGMTMPAARVSLLAGSVSGTQTYRPDGLPGPAQQTTRMTLQTSMTVKNVRVTITSEQEDTVSTQAP